MNWFFAGLPLLLSGISGIVSAIFLPDYAILFFSIGLFQVLASLLALSSERALRIPAVVAWIPWLFFLPLGTLFAYLAIKQLLGGPARSPAVIAHVQELPAAEVGQLVRDQAQVYLDVLENQTNRSLDDLCVAPVELITFLDDLNIRFGLPVTSDDNKLVDTVEDIVRLVEQRRTKSAGA